jgi:hypothetical protein
MAAVVTEYAKITARHLRGAEEMCRRRLAKEVDDQRGNPPSGARFGVSNRLTADVRLAHTEFAPPDPRAFVPPADLVPEQQRVYGAAVTGYLALFGAEVARAVDVGFDTTFEALEVRLVGDIGIALETETGCELRVLRLGERGFGQSLLDDVDLRFAALRAAAWVAGRGPLRVVAADVLNLSRADLVIEVADFDDAHAFLEDRLRAVRALAADPRPRAGRDCLGCKFVAGCDAHRER